MHIKNKFRLLSAYVLMSAPMLAMTADEFNKTVEAAQKADPEQREQMIFSAIDAHEPVLARMIINMCGSQTLEKAIVYTALKRSHRMALQLAYLCQNPTEIIVELAKTPIDPQMIRTILAARTYEQKYIDKMLISLCQILPNIQHLGCINAILEKHPSSAALDEALLTAVTFTDAYGTACTCPESKILACTRHILDWNVSRGAVQRACVDATANGLESVAACLAAAL